MFAPRVRVGVGQRIYHVASILLSCEREGLHHTGIDRSSFKGAGVVFSSVVESGELWAIFAPSAGCLQDQNKFRSYFLLRDTPLRPARHGQMRDVLSLSRPANRPLVHVSMYNVRFCFFWHAVCSLAAEGCSRTVGRGESKGAFGTLRRMSGSRSSSVAVLPAFNVAELAPLFTGLRFASQSPVSVNDKPHNLLLFFNSPLRSRMVVPSSIFRPLYISPIVVAPSAVCNGAATYSQQQQQRQQRQQHMSRASCVCICCT